MSDALLSAAPVPNPWPRRIAVVAGGLLSLLMLALALRLFLAGEAMAGVLWSCVVGVGIFVFLSSRAYAWRYLYPGVAATLVFVVFPIIYTFYIGFSNYGGKNLLTHERTLHYLLEETYATAEGNYGFTLHGGGNAWRVRLEDPEGQVFLSPELKLNDAKPQKVEFVAASATESLGEPVSIKTLLTVQKGLKALTARLPDGAEAGLSGLRQFAPAKRLYQKNADGSLTNLRDNTKLVANFETGYWVDTATGENVPPGFKVNVGLANFTRVFTEPKFREPFARIFVWTVVFAGLTVVFTFALGSLLAVVLNWEALRFRNVYRTLLFLPYAVPGFISILVFRGLFNQSFGEINLILDGLFGIRFAWMTDPFLAKAMLLIVNTWLGYPYIMLLAMGLIKSIPADLYEASAIAGAGPIMNFFKITLPLITKPMLPLLVASFAFNFNNFVLVSFLTRGGPDFLDTQVQAGATDIIVSYTYRIAFVDSGQHFGLAAAISTVVFLLVALLSLLQMRLMKVGLKESR